MASGQVVIVRAGKQQTLAVGAEGARARVRVRVRNHSVSEAPREVSVAPEDDVGEQHRGCLEDLGVGPTQAVRAVGW